MFSAIFAFSQNDQSGNNKKMKQSDAKPIVVKQDIKQVESIKLDTDKRSKEVIRKKKSERKEEEKEIKKSK